MRPNIIERIKECVMSNYNNNWKLPIDVYVRLTPESYGEFADYIRDQLTGSAKFMADEETHEIVNPLNFDLVNIEFKTLNLHGIMIIYLQSKTASRDILRIGKKIICIDTP